MRGLAWLVVAFVLLGCAERQAARREVDALLASMAAHERVLDETSARASRLSGKWARVAEQYGNAEAGYREAAEKLAQARARYERASAQFERASRRFEDAKFYWKVFRSLVVAAAYLDAQSVDAARGWTEGFTCDSMSTSEYRRYLESQGADLTGVDIDHIVPKSIGGADHPLNYQRVPSSLNRSLGNRWVGKCRMAGTEASACALAATVSIRCGSFQP
ncbi:MAG: hypothetical protein ACOC9T_00620 [Myxococcota bacterium]